MSSSINPDPGTDGRTRTSGSAASTTTSTSSQQDLVARQKEQFGGMKFGCSFFGWLTANGTVVLLTALLAAIGAAAGMNGLLGDAAADNQNVRTIGLVSGIVLLVVVLVAYLAGGYVAARMARFSGLKQGLGVWLWAVIATIVAGVLGFVAGDNFDLLSRVNGLRIPVNQSDLAGGGIIAVAALGLVSLIGALLGGLAGMRYHRRVDRATFDDV